jgi:pilus assembly protein CpaD
MSGSGQIMKPYPTAGKVLSMSTTRSSFLPRLAAVTLVVVAAGLLQSCGANRDKMTTGAIPDDYRTRHPISLAEAEHTLDIPVASGDRRMTVGTRDVVQGFVAEYRARSSGVFRIEYPAGSVNADAASHARRELRQLLGEAGVPRPSIIETVYGASPNGDAAPIRLSYVAITAMTNECGQWPEDIANNTSDNKNWYNFGCASQNNLAAQIADPMDLVAPRGMSPIDAKRRTNVIELYRQGKRTASAAE